jgi:hypothetical protein
VPWNLRLKSCKADVTESTDLPPGVTNISGFTRGDCKSGGRPSGLTQSEPTELRVETRATLTYRATGSDKGSYPTGTWAVWLGTDCGLGIIGGTPVEGYENAGA